jgi:hypothetical protein
VKLTFSGFGCLIPILAPIAFLAAMLALPAHERDDWWVLGALGIGLAAVILPLAFGLHRAGRSHDHFMHLPVGVWGGLFLLAGLGFFGMAAFEHFGRAEEGAAGTAASAECAELESIMGSCTSLPPGAGGMFRSMCEASSPEVGVACLACVRSAADPCDPRACDAACRFGPR